MKDRIVIYLHFLGSHVNNAHITHGASVPWRTAAHVAAVAF
jgi:hypothetical protein